MALAYTRRNSRPDQGRVVTDIVLDGSYSAGGYAVSLPAVGMIGTPDQVEMTYIHATATNTFLPVYDYANNKIKIFKSGTAGATFNECVSGDITSSHSIRFVASGTPIL
jgi:hypothetical protein